MNYVAESRNYAIFAGVNLNLNFPSKVGTVKVGEREIEYGYSSGIYTKHVSTFTPVRSLPSQDDIDALGGGKRVSDWHRRFDLAYEKCKDENVTLVGGVCPTTIRFARYLYETYKIYPKDLWNTQLMTLGSVPGINTHQGAALGALYGKAVIREIYGATEGMFGQQRDARTRLGAQLRSLLLRSAHIIGSQRCCTRCAQARWAGWWSPHPFYRATALAT